MTGRKVIIILVSFFVAVTASAQKVHVKAANEPLSSVVKRLNAEVSFDNRVLSKYRITIDQSFSSPEKAINYLISNKPLVMKKVAGVYIITEKKVETVNVREKTPYEYVVKKRTDTLSMNLNMSLKEIVITAKNHTPSMHGEDLYGANHINSITANVMPGYSDNSIFNVLRMMPGIRASGEPSDELYVWGSSPGESRVTLDGIPLFAMQSYNSNISYINPYMSEEVNYKRGILSADEGSQTGAKVDVVSGVSQLEKPIFKGMVSTMSANFFGAVPLGCKCMLSAAYRHTLQSVFGGSTFDAYRKRDDMNPQTSNRNSGLGTNVIVPVTQSLMTRTTTTSTGDASTTPTPPDSTSTTSTTITPAYKFQDINVNLTGVASWNTSYKVTLYGAKDYLDYDRNDTVNANGDKTSYQGGASLNIGKVWENKNRSELSSFISGLRSTQNGNMGSGGGTFVNTERVTQFNVKFQQSGIAKLQGLDAGGELTTYRVRNSNVSQSVVQPTLFVDEKYNIGTLNIEAGLRTDLMSSGVKWQPRTMLKYNFLKYFTLTSSWGIYNQYLVKNPYKLFDNSYQFVWDINTSLKSINTIGGISFDCGGLNVSMEAYMKKIHNSVWVVNNQLGLYNFDLKGIDISSKYNWRHGLFFASWSLSDDPRQTDGVANEVKAGGIVRFYPFTFSVNFVYGSGYNSMLLPNSSFEQRKVNADGSAATTTQMGTSTTSGATASSTTVPTAAPTTTATESSSTSSNSSTTYSRMDIYASYEHRFKYFGVSVGASLINVFDTDNKKYVTSWMPRSESNSFYTQASRFTPIIFLEIKF